MTNIKEENSETGLEVAVIGMDGRFPGAKHIDEFWENLKNGKDSISFFSDEELLEAGTYPGLLENSNYVKSKAIIDDIEYFDAAFFGYTPNETILMDPQVRIFHECAWHALEDAGYDPYSFEKLIGCYVGAPSNFVWQALVLLSGREDAKRFEARNLLDKDYISTRLAYKLDLKGPAITMQTACSTSLVAIHLAWQGLISGECDIALAGGVSILNLKKDGYLFQEGMILSADGHCRTFDARADGAIFGDGVGVVVLKRLEDAISDRDNIYAVIKGSFINNDGIKKSGYTAPSSEGQAAVIQTAHSIAGIEPASLGYIETHGTGTAIGDPIELEGLKLAFNTEKKGFCALGSVKSNVGHLNIAAGVAGFIKTVLALKNRLIPPSLHFENPNPKIDFDNSPFFVNTRLSGWKNDKYPLRAGVSSFGIGGTNAHVVLEEAPRLEDSSASREFQLFLLSAKTLSSLDRMTENFANHLKKQKHPGFSLADAAYTLQTGRKSFNSRRMTVCSTSKVEEAIEALSSHTLPKVQTFLLKGEDKPLVFMFSGQGSQYVNMGLELYKNEPVFRRELDRCIAILETAMGYNIKKILYPGEAGSGLSLEDAKRKMDDVIYSGPIKFSFEYALAKLIMSWGIKPDAMIGHSFGEYAVAQLAGVFSLEDALRLVALRGRLMKKMPPGAMMSVPLSEEELKPILNDELSLAAVNTSSMCIVSGPSAVVDQLEQELNEKGHECLRINFPRASHSKMVCSILKEFTENLRQVKFNKPKIPYISGFTGDWLSVDEAAFPAYLARHVTETVRFSDGVKKLLKELNPIFVQVGCDRGLPLFVNQHLDENSENLVMNLVRHPKEKISDVYYLLNSIGFLWLHGIEIDWQAFYSQERRHRLSLPTYPFERQRYWIDGNLSQIGSEVASRKSLISKRSDMADWFYIPSWKRFKPPLQKKNCLAQSAKWLILMDDCGVALEFVKRLERDDQDVILGEIGLAFRKVNKNHFIINPRNPNDYIKLFNELSEIEKIPTMIIHLWNITRANKKAVDAVLVEKYLDLGFYSIIYLAQAIGELETAENIKIEVVTNNMQEVTGEETLRPEKAAILGPCKAIPQEYPNISCRSIDILLHEFKGKKDRKLLDQLIVEFNSSVSDTVIAYRSGHRWVQFFESIKLNESLEERQRLRQGGIYLITGGLGGVGFTIAEYLAKHLHAKLILTGRSEFPTRDRWEKWLVDSDEDDTVSRKIRRIQELEKLGAEVLALSADVANQDHMQKVIAQAEMQFGPINGVIHAAGITAGPSFCPIEKLDKTRCNMQFQPKIFGVLVLERLLAKKELDFVLLTSSISSILGGLGFLAYSTANIFMDAFAYYHNQGNSFHWTSVNWDSWQLSGQKPIHKNFKTTLSDLVMEPEEGIKAFLRILSYDDAPQVVNSTGDLQARINQWINLESLRDEEQDESLQESSTLFQPRPNLSNPYAPPGSKVEQDICDLWQKLFGFEQIGIDDDFYEIGGDSLKAVTITSQIKKLGYQVALTDVLASSTIRELAAMIGEKGISKELAEKAYEEVLLSKLQCLEKLNNGRNKKNIFIIHPLHGMVNQYKKLAVLLENEYNVYGIQARGLIPGSTTAESPEEMLNDYLDHILTVQRNGPYIIAGYCTGVVIAYEIVSKLEKLNHLVEKLILFDTYAFFSDRYTRKLRILEHLPDFVRKALLSSNERKFRKRKLKENFDEVEHVGIVRDEMNAEVNLRREKVKKNIRFLAVHILSLEIIKAPIFVAIAMESDYPRISEEHFNKMTKDKAVVIKTPGDHNSIFEDPYVENLAEILKNNI